MTALVDRLRIDVLWHQRRGNETIARDCQEAADEIERLRDALAAVVFEGLTHDDRLTSSEALHARLLAAKRGNDGRQSAN